MTNEQRISLVKDVINHVDVNYDLFDIKKTVK